MRRRGEKYPTPPIARLAQSGTGLRKRYGQWLLEFIPILFAGCPYVAPKGNAVKDYLPRKLGFTRIPKYEKARFLGEPTENNSVRKESGSWLENQNGRRRDQISHGGDRQRA